MSLLIYNYSYVVLNIEQKFQYLYLLILIVLFIYLIHQIAIHYLEIEMKVLAFAATNSIKSINKELISYATTLLNKHEVEIIDINDYQMPIYSIDLEEAHGIPEAAADFVKKIADADVLLISYAEHNGSYTVAYKNLFDWASRKSQKVYQDKSIVMMSTSPGPGGATSVLQSAENSAHFFDGKVLATLSIPSFYENFDSVKCEISNPELNEQLKAVLAKI